MTEEMIHVLQAMAMGLLASDDMGDECLYCNVRGSFTFSSVIEDSQVPHKADCPVLTARRILHQQNIPLNIYNMTGEEQWGKKQWRSFTGQTLAISEREAIRNYQGRDGERRNVRAEFVCIFPLTQLPEEQA